MKGLVPVNGVIDHNVMPSSARQVAHGIELIQPKTRTGYCVEKGSITVDAISLTIIPHTRAHTKPAGPANWGCSEF